MCDLGCPAAPPFSPLLAVKEQKRTAEDTEVAEETDTVGKLLRYYATEHRG